MIRRILRRIGVVFLILLVLVLVVPLLIPVSPAQGLSTPRDLAREYSQFVTVPFEGTDGVDLHYREAGEGDLTFVLLHGFTYNLTTWDTVFDWFAQRGRTIAYDRAPYGLSERLLPGDWTGPHPYGDDGEMAQLIALLDALEVEQAVLVGNSAGGSLALRTAVTHPERVEALLLLAPAVYAGGAPGFADALLDLPQFERLGPLFVRSLASRNIIGTSAYADPANYTAEREQNYLITTQVNNWDAAVYEDLRAPASAVDLPAALPDLNLPVLVIAGEEDQIVPVADSVRAAQAIPGAELVTIAACGHFPQEECADEMLQAAADWLAAWHGPPGTDDGG